MLRGELSRQIEKPPGGDSRIAAFSEAALDGLDNTYFGKISKEVLDHRKISAGSYAANLLLRGVQNQLIELDPDYPLSYTDAKSWKKGFDMICNDQINLGKLEYDLGHRNVQSNVVERYKAVKLAAGLMHSRLGDGARILDVACSRNHGLSKLKLNLPFKPITFGSDNSGCMPSLFIDKLVRQTIGQPLSLGRSVGTDLVPISSGEDAVWTRSCSFYPSELLNIAAVTEYDYLDNNQIPGVDFVLGNFASRGLNDESIEKSFDIVSVSTFLYQLQPEQRLRARELFRENLGRDGIIVYLDFAHPTDDGQNLIFKESWFDELFPYRTLVEFGSDQTHRVYELFCWDNGRCNKWVPGKDLKEILEYES